METEEQPCPNPKGMTVEFAQEIIETRAWRLKGVGAHGSDVDVIALDEYRELAHLQRTTLETLSRWADSATKAQAELEHLRPVVAAAEEMVRTAHTNKAAHSMDALRHAVDAAGMGNPTRDNADL